MKKLYLALGILLLLCFGLSWPATGSMASALYIVAVLATMSVLLPAIVIAVVLLIKGGKRKVKKAAPSTSETVVAHDAHHPKDDANHGHEHGHGHGHSHGTPLWKTVLGWCLALVAIILLYVFWKTWAMPRLGLDQIPGASSEQRLRISETYGTPQSTGPTCQTDPIEPYTITAPPKGEGWSVRVPVPKCHRIRFCDKTQDPDCTAKDFAESRFVPKCTSPRDSTAREFARARDKHSDACWIQSKGSEALSILVIAEFDPST